MKQTVIKGIDIQSSNWMCVFFLRKMAALHDFHACVPPFKFLILLTGFHEIECYSSCDLLSLVCFNFLWTVLTTWCMLELVRWEWPLIYGLEMMYGNRSSKSTQFFVEYTMFTWIRDVLFILGYLKKKDYLTVTYLENTKLEWMILCHQ
jgi:hypothetical protein